MKFPRMFRRVSSVLFYSAMVFTTTPASAAIIYESGTLGPTGLTFDDFGGTDPSGSRVDQEVFSGVRFHLSETVMTTRVGGHFVIRPLSDDTFFGAIVQLNEETDFPDSNDLSTPDVLGHTLLTFPATSTEVFGDLTTTLNPGWYALVFGSGLFGATGEGAAIANNPDLDSPSYIAFVLGGGWIETSPPNGPFENFRFVVEGTIIPEPNSAVMALVAAMILIMRRPGATAGLPQSCSARDLRQLK